MRLIEGVNSGSRQCKPTERPPAPELQDWLERMDASMRTADPGGEHHRQLVGDRVGNLNGGLGRQRVNRWSPAGTDFSARWSRLLSTLIFVLQERKEAEQLQQPRPEAGGLRARPAKSDSQCRFGVTTPSQITLGLHRTPQALHRLLYTRSPRVRGGLTVTDFGIRSLGCGYIAAGTSETI